MPITFSRLRELSPGPTVQEVIDNPGRYPEVEQGALRVLRAWQEAQLQRVFSPMAESANALMSGFASLAIPGLRVIDELPRDAASTAWSFLHVTREAVEAIFQAQRIIGHLFAPGTFWGDLHRARKGDVEALARLPSHVHWEPKHPDARRALAERAEVEGREAARRQALMVGFYEAFQREGEPQRIRFGREYLQAESGSLLLRPVELPIRLYFHWLRKEVVNGMESYLLGEPYPMSEKRRPLPIEEGEELSAEELVLIREAEEECRRQLETVLAQATPRQRDILLVALETGPEWATVARRLGLDPGAVRAQLTLLRRRLV